MSETPEFGRIFESQLSFNVADVAVLSKVNIVKIKLPGSLIPADRKFVLLVGEITTRACHLDDEHLIGILDTLTVTLEGFRGLEYLRVHVEFVVIDFVFVHQIAQAPNVFDHP